MPSSIGPGLPRGWPGNRTLHNPGHAEPGSFRGSKSVAFGMIITKSIVLFVVAGAGRVITASRWLEKFFSTAAIARMTRKMTKTLVRLYPASNSR